MSSEATVAAVISLYNPPSELVARVERLLKQVDLIVAVDDGTPHPDPVFFEQLAQHATVIRLEENSGIAAALNAGIARSRSAIAPDWILTLDQDSELDPDFVENALATARRAHTAGLRVGAITPEAHNGRRIDLLSPRDEFRDGFDPMQSGTLISDTAAEHVGLLDEGLFIDAVDSEYTARLREHGYRVLAGNLCNIAHSVGQARPMRIFGRRLRIAGNDLNVYYHSPFRVYYMARNSIHLTRRYLLSQPAWVTKRLLLETTFHGIRFTFGPHRKKLALAFLHGTVDGIRGRTGRIPMFIEKQIDPQRTR